ncbi:MAG: polyprenyl diphosphate synthase [Patescibacteria group bacterium]|nr:polyprenyl diphosphate synthase [Patescibacteria group bacterium]
MNNDNQKVPNHVAIVPDGNRRWAKSQGLDSWDGHREGAKRIEEIVREALRIKIKSITFWGSSEDNFEKRPLQEKKALLEVYEEYFKKLVNSDDVFDNKARINVVGKWEQQFPKKLVSILKEGIEKTKDHSNYFLNFLLAYNGSSDILAAVKAVAKSFAKDENTERIDAEHFGKGLLTRDLPNVDLLIRTGVQEDPHNSAGFLMWQTQNSQYYFSDRMFPDFDVKEFQIALADYSGRVRRLGA